MDKLKPFGFMALPKKAKTFPGKSNALFESDSDDEPKKRKAPKIPQAKPLPKLVEAEDPSIYEYDEVYDEMKAQEEAKIAPKVTDKPSRYIDSLLKAADKRKKIQERRQEKKVQSEREKEGDKFKDKESFVTSTYKKIKQEKEEEEERERRKDELNDMMDVTKQEDFRCGFYRSLHNQVFGEEKVPIFGKRSFKKEPEFPESQVTDEVVSEKLDWDSDIPISSDNEDRDSECKDSRSRSRSYDDDEKIGKVKSKKRKFQCKEKNVHMKEKKRRTKSELSESKSGRNSVKVADRKERKSADGSDSESGSKVNDQKAENSKSDLVKDKKSLEKDSKSHMFKKRTFRFVFTDAQARYFQRMSACSFDGKNCAGMNFVQKYC